MKMNIRSVAAMGWLLAFALLVSSGCAHRDDGSTPVKLRVLSYNIHHGEGMDGRLDLERIAALITAHAPDLVALQEVDRGVARTQGRDLPAELAKATGMEVIFSRNIEYQGGDYGNAILSRFPVVSSTNLHYRMLRPGEQRGLLQATVRHPSGRELVFMATHLDYRSDPVERLSNVPEIKAARERFAGLPVIVAGDFNDRPGGEVHGMMKSGFIDAWEAAGNGDGFTYSSTNPDKRIDYIYFDRDSGWRIIRAEVLVTEASDHLPLLVEAVLP
ncbi:MAG TPA: endonuclease [Verrucomicrobiales bacterium]|nr:endonuclease [Verrucomicrobiales bacterium]